MTDIAELGLYIDSSGVVRATDKLGKLRREGKKTEVGAKKLEGRFNTLKIAAGALAGSFAIKKFFQTSASFESMSVSLKTVTGSAEKASMAMDGIRDFAKNTPFQVSEITDAFIKLKAMGLSPTEASLTSFGNTSSAMGKSLNQMIEAVADAATGEFERLKEFGIKSKSEGDKVSFTFQGITTTVGKNADEIKAYLQSIGEENFAGAMSEQMKTLNGKISNLGDATDDLIVTFATMGAQDGAKGAIDLVIDGVNLLKEGLVSLNELGEDFGTSLANWFNDTNIKSQRQMKDEMESLHESMKDIKKTMDEKGVLGKNIDTELYQLKALTAQYNDLKKVVKPDEKPVKNLIEEAGVDPIAEKAKRDAANQAKLDSDIEYALNKQQYDADVVNNAKTLADKEKADKKQAMSETFGTLAVLTASSNKKMFKIGKAASIASAVINTHEAISKTMAKTPYPWNIPLAAAQAAAGVVQVQAIKSQQFGQAHKGMDYVNNTGSYQLQKGEMVLDKGTSDNVRNNVMGSNSISVQILANDAASFEAQVGRSGDVIWNTILERMNENGLRFA